MTDEESRAHVVRMRSEGMKLSDIATAMNELGSVTISGQQWTGASVQYALRWEPRVSSQTWELVHDPHELLKANPNHSAALMDLEDRRRYFATGKYCHKRIKAVYARYAK